MEFLSGLFGISDPKLIAMTLLAIVFGIYMAWTIGANDVANAMATSVGSGSLTYRQAILVAGIMEFAGAVLAGSHVTDTIRKGIVNAELFNSDPLLLMLGMLSALLAAALWLHAATIFGLPVSTTHSIVGAVVGFGLLVYGMNSVHWNKILQIVLSWIISPISGGIVAFFIFKLIRWRVFSASNTRRALSNWVPFFAGLTIAIIILSSIYKGLKNINIDTRTAILLAVGAGSLTYGILRITLNFIKPTKKKDLDFIERIFMILQVITAAY
ncbi:inorganic phosphate transporter, partial [Calditrichota bacterium]